MQKEFENTLYGPKFVRNDIDIDTYIAGIKFHAKCIDLSVDTGYKETIYP